MNLNQVELSRLQSAMINKKIRSIKNRSRISPVQLNLLQQNQLQRSIAESSLSSAMESKRPEKYSDLSRSVQV
jgi:hypothetical protein